VPQIVWSLQEKLSTNVAIKMYPSVNISLLVLTHKIYFP